jgi:lipoic acid synthetase
MESPLVLIRRPAQKPDWLKVKAPGSPRYIQLKRMMGDLRLNTVCEEAHCPNIGECWHHGTATFMLLGDVCTRNCPYCAVAHGRPNPIDPDEPARVAAAAEQMQLRYVVLTSVDRDDLPDGGAAHFAATVRAVRRALPGAGIEVLTPDFKGDREALVAVLESEPEVFNHNIETVPRLFPRLRPQGRYRLSLDVLAAAKALRPEQSTKSGLMVGLGETDEEVTPVLADLRGAGVDIVTIGQYLRPTRDHEPVHRYVTPEAFRTFEARARAIGFPTVYSGVFVRSSFNAEEVYRSGGAR